MKIKILDSQNFIKMMTDKNTCFAVTNNQVFIVPTNIIELQIDSFKGGTS